MLDLTVHGNYAELSNHGVSFTCAADLWLVQRA